MRCIRRYVLSMSVWSAILFCRKYKTQIKRMCSVHIFLCNAMMIRSHCANGEKVPTSFLTLEESIKAFIQDMPIHNSSSRFSLSVHVKIVELHQTMTVLQFTICQMLEKRVLSVLTCSDMFGYKLGSSVPI